VEPGRRRPFAPKLVDETVGGDELVGMKEQVREKRLLFPAAQCDASAIFDDLERTEYAELHARSRR
jgi:hypothetical protein